MNEAYTDNHTNQEEDSFQSIQKFIAMILRKWYWLLLSVAVALLVAWYITRNSEPVYRVSASILVRDPEQFSNSIGDLIYGEKFMNTGSSIENEVFLIRRFSLIRSTLEELGYETMVFEEESPVRIRIDSASTHIPHGLGLTLDIKSPEKYTLASEEEEVDEIIQGKEFKFGETVNLDGFKFVVLLDRQGFVNYLRNQKAKQKKDEPEESEREIYFQVNDLDKLADHYISAIQAEPLDEKATIFQLSVESTWPAKDIKFLNALTRKYLESDHEEKISVATQTMDFLDEQLTFISDSLNRIESQRERFKMENTIDLSKEGSQLYENIQELEKSKSEIQMRQKYLSYLEKYLKSNKDTEGITVPSTLGITDPVLNSLVEELVKQQIELRKAKSTPRGPQNPTVVRKKELIEDLKGNILETVDNLQSGERIAERDLDRRIGGYTANLQSLPAAERKYIDIERKYNLSETLYLFLMEKRTESGIAKASTAPDFKIVDEARVQNGGRPVAPKPMMNYATAVLLGLLIPVAFIYISDKLNNKLYTQEDLLGLTSIPLLGMVGKNKFPEDVIINHPQSAVAESFRSIRSSLRYMADYKPANKTFMLSSAISGEGKTFCAKNLAYIFSISGKNTVYINTDLRKINSYKQFGLEKNTGLSDYLINIVPQEAIVHRTDFSNLYIVPAGDMPPNPSELLMSERFRDLMAYLKENFHYIIMDAPPRGILSDGMELVKYADVEIFVIRQGYTERQHVVNLDRMYHREKGKFPPAGIIFNDVDFDKLEYGFKQKSAYGYNYFSEEPKPWWKRVFGA